MMSYAAIDMYLQYWCTYIMQYNVKNSRICIWELCFSSTDSSTIFHTCIFHYNGVSAVLRGGADGQLPKVPTYECINLTGLIENIVLVNTG